MLATWMGPAACSPPNCHAAFCAQMLQPGDKSIQDSRSPHATRSMLVRARLTHRVMQDKLTPLLHQPIRCSPLETEVVPHD